jgi:hypothetical protein
MRPRELILLGSACGLLALGGIAFFAQETQAEELQPGAPAATSPAATADPAPQPTAPAAQENLAPAVASAPVTGSLAPNERRVDTSGWTKGTIKGDIQLAVSVLGRIETIRIVVEEARQALGPGKTFVRPYRQVVPVAITRGTPTFEVTDIPFSAYPYIVSVQSPGLNGNRRTLTIDSKTPFVDDVLLSITPGAPLSVLVRDQDNAPFTGLDVRVMAVGEPPERPSHQGTTDNFGSVVFDSVLAGDYQVFVNQNGQALADAQTITVQPGAPASRSKVLGQSLPLTIPRGVGMRLLVHDRAGYGIADATVEAIMTDRVRLTPRQTTTNAGGVAEFSHLQAGQWHIRVTKDKHDMWDRQFTVKMGQDPPNVDVVLVPSR